LRRRVSVDKVLFLCYDKISYFGIFRQKFAKKQPENAACCKEKRSAAPMGARQTKRLRISNTETSARLF